MAFKEVNPGIWKPENEGDKIEGVLISRQSNVGENKSNLYAIEQGDGTIMNVWGSAVLDSRLALIKNEDKIRITFKGLGEKSGGKNAPKLFSVEKDDGSESPTNVVSPAPEKPSFS